MNNDEAKFILQGYRPNGADAGDETMRTALEQVRQDPSLREWFAREQAFDRGISGKLSEVSAPVGLKEAILAGGRVSRAAGQATGWWRSPTLWAAAASIAVILGAALALWPKQAIASTGLPEYVVADAAHEENHMGGHGTETLKAMLGDPTTRLGRGLPISFDALLKGGCRTVQYQGRDVLEVCFNRNGVWFHAYIGRRSDFPEISTSPSFLDGQDGVAVAAWADQQHIYLVAGKAGRAVLQSLL